MVKPLPEATHCAIRLRASASRLMRRLRASIPGDGLGVAQLSVLGRLHQAGLLTPTALAEREGVRLQSLTRLLAELEAEGRVVRRPHASDGRQSVLSLTAKGARLLAADVHRREASLAEAIDAQLTPAQRRQLLAACALIERVTDGIAASAGAVSEARPRSRRTA